MKTITVDLSKDPGERWALSATDALRRRSCLIVPLANVYYDVIKLVMGSPPA